MKKLLIFFMGMVLLSGTANATVGWNKSIPATSENPQAISPDVIENNTALDLMLQNYRDGYVSLTLSSTSLITVGSGGVMIQNSGGSTRLMVSNSSTSSLSPTSIDTGSISPSSTYYIYAYASSTTATTFSVIFSASATSPTGITYYHRLGQFTTDGSSNFVSITNDVNLQTSFGAWTSGFSSNTPYLANTDGIVTVSNSGAYYEIVETDSNTNPTTQRAQGYGGTMCPVRKGDYWKETNNGGTATIYFISH